MLKAELMAPAAAAESSLPDQLAAKGAAAAAAAAALQASVAALGPGLLDAAVLGWFAVRQVGAEVAAQAAGGSAVGGVAVGHLAHLGGALAGVLLVTALRQLPGPGPDA